MPTKPKRVEPKATTAQKEPTSLYNAVRDRLKAQDAKTLHARTQKAVEAFEGYLGGKPLESEAAPVSVTNIVNQAAMAPWGLEGLVVDPDPKESVGKVGWFWDDGDLGVVRFGVSADPEGSIRTYESAEDMSWDHFAYIPGFPGAELLKRTSGYEAPK